MRPNEHHTVAMSSSQARADQGADHAAQPGHAELAERLGARLGPAAAFATTEHFNLQTARGLTVAEANGRASIYSPEAIDRAAIFGRPT